MRLPSNFSKNRSKFSLSIVAKIAPSLSHLYSIKIESLSFPEAYATALFRAKAKSVVVLSILPVRVPATAYPTFSFKLVKEDRGSGKG